MWGCGIVPSCSPGSLCSPLLSHCRPHRLILPALIRWSTVVCAAVSPSPCPIVWPLPLLLRLDLLPAGLGGHACRFLICACAPLRWLRFSAPPPPRPSCICPAATRHDNGVRRLTLLAALTSLWLIRMALFASGRTLLPLIRQPTDRGPSLHSRLRTLPRTHQPMSSAPSDTSSLLTQQPDLACVSASSISVQQAARPPQQASLPVHHDAPSSNGDTRASEPASPASQPATASALAPLSPPVSALNREATSYYDALMGLRNNNIQSINLVEWQTLQRWKELSAALRVSRCHNYRGRSFSLCRRQ